MQRYYTVQRFWDWKAQLIPVANVNFLKHVEAMPNRKHRKIRVTDDNVCGICAFRR